MDGFAASTARSLARNLADAASDVKPDRESLFAVGERLVPLVARAVASDIGDTSMSNWRRGHPIPIGGAAHVSADGLMITRDRTSAGMMRVLQDGRQSYAKGDRRQSGTYVSKKTGERTLKTRKVKRDTAASAGKGTWVDAEVLMHDAAPSAVFGTVGEEMATRIMEAVTRGL